MLEDRRLNVLFKILIYTSPQNHMQVEGKK